MQRREIILLDETPELQDGTEESATKRQRTSRKSSQAQHPKNPRSEVTTLTRSRKSLSTTIFIGFTFAWNPTGPSKWIMANSSEDGIDLIQEQLRKQFKDVTATLRSKYSAWRASVQLLCKDKATRDPQLREFIHDEKQVCCQSSQCYGSRVALSLHSNQTLALHAEYYELSASFRTVSAKASFECDFIFQPQRHSQLQGTVQDEAKLLAYLNATQEMGICLGGGGIGPMTVTAYVEASYGVINDAEKAML